MKLDRFAVELIKLISKKFIYGHKFLCHLFKFMWHTSPLSLKVALVHQTGSGHFSLSNSCQAVPWHFKFWFLLFQFLSVVWTECKAKFPQPLVNWWIKHDVDIKSNRNRICFSGLTVNPQLLHMQWFWRVHFRNKFPVSICFDHWMYAQRNINEHLVQADIYLWSYLR